MKTIWKIAKTELQSLFYSPIAWLVLVIFFVQCAVSFNTPMESAVTSMEIRGYVYKATESIFISQFGGMFPKIQSYLYLYLPLLTMALMTREFTSGSIKLLYSSPITNRQIILGKYFAMMIYSAIMVGCVAIFAIFGFATIDMVEIPRVLTGLLGFYLLTCTYAAIGLFMSCITTYQIVAAVCTLTVLFLLSQVRSFAQEVEFVRDLAFWLSINGRVGEFISGLICSEDLLYFILVSTMFIMFSIIKLQADRTKAPWFKTTGKVLAVVVATLMVGYLSTQPKLMWYFDASRDKVNTLTKNSQDIVAKLNDKTTITYYHNILGIDQHMWYAFPAADLNNIKRFKQYVRFKPDIKIKFVRYYAIGENRANLEKTYPGLTAEEMMLRITRVWRRDSSLFISKDSVDQIEPGLRSENYRLVMAIERANGRKTFLRVFNDMQVWPSEAEISAALKRLTDEQLPRVAFVKGHGERDIENISDRGYNTVAKQKTFRHSLLNQGVDFAEITLDKEIDKGFKTVVIAEMREPLTAAEEEVLAKYIEEGGNLIFAGEPRRHDIMNPVANKFLGVDFTEGQLVKPDTMRIANLSVVWPTVPADSIAYHFRTIRLYEYCASMPTAMGLDYTKAIEKGFTVTELFKTDSLYWNEKQTTDFVDEVPVYNPEKGELMKSWPTAIAMSRKVGDKVQKIIVLGDADCISNGELSISRRGIPAMNYYLVAGSFFWLSDNEVPIDVRRPSFKDRAVKIGNLGMTIWKVVSFGLIPVALTLCGILIWIRRKGR